MPWETKNRMNQRSEFVLKAMKTENFRELCREYKISPRVAIWAFSLELGGCKERHLSQHCHQLVGGVTFENGSFH